MRPGDQEPRGGGDDDQQVETPEARAAEVLDAAQVDDVVHEEDEPRHDADDDGDHLARLGSDDQRQDGRDDDGKPECCVEALEEGGVCVAPRFTLANRIAGELGHPDILPAPAKPTVDRPGSCARRVRRYAPRLPHGMFPLAEGGWRDAAQGDVSVVVFAVGAILDFAVTVNSGAEGASVTEPAVTTRWSMTAAATTCPRRTRTDREALSLRAA